MVLMTLAVVGATLLIIAAVLLLSKLFGWAEYTQDRLASVPDKD